MSRRLCCALVWWFPCVVWAADTATVDVQASAAPIVFAGEELRAALKAAGWSLSDTAGGAKLAITLVEPDGQGAAESFAVTVEPAGDRSVVRVQGCDARGVMYGGLDVAEQIAVHQGELRIEPRNGRPFLPVRGLKFNIPLAGNVYLSAEDQAHGEWFWDLEYWRAFVRFLAYNRYNLLSFWNSHPYDQMVRIEKFPEANGLPPEKLAANVAFFHALFKLARDHGLDTSIVTWNIHSSAAFRQAHNIKDGEDSPLIRDYQRECVRCLLKEYPELTGMGTCPGEAMGGVAGPPEEWIRQTYFPGIADAGRTKLPFILRYWGGTPPATAAMLEKAQYDGPVYLDIKFNGEHMYSSTKPHLKNQEWLNQRPMPYQLLWHLRNDCIYQFRWFDLDFAESVVRNCGGPDSAGFVMGSEIEVPGVDRVHTPQTVAHKTWKYEFEKNWTRFGVWGRVGFNPDEPRSFWAARFSQRFGPQAGPKVMEALTAASKIIPLTTSFHWNYMNGDWYPEGNVGNWNTSAEMPFPNYRDRELWHNILEWTFNHVIDDTFQSIPDHVALRVMVGETDSSGVITPPRFAEQLETAAAACATARAQAAASVFSSGQNEWACTELDLRALELLGRYYAAKARAATEVMLFLALGEEPHRASAIAQLTQALDLWKQLSAAADSHYATHEIWLFGKQFDWKRYIPEAERDIQIVRDLVPWPRIDQEWYAPPAGNGSLIRGFTSRSWSLPAGSPSGLNAWPAVLNGLTLELEDATTQGPEGRTMGASLEVADAGTAVITLHSTAIKTATINGQMARVVGGAPEQSVVGPIRAGSNNLALTFARQVAVPRITGKSVLAADTVFIEAEAGQLTAPVEAQELPGASGGKVIVSPKGKGRGEGDGGKIVDNGWATYQIEIPADGAYVIHACAFWPDTSANSFFYAWDAAAPKMLGNDEAFKTWHWVATPAEKLTAGKHTLTLRNRDEGSILDCLLVARDETRTQAAMLDAYYERLSAPHHIQATSLEAWKTRRQEIRQHVLRDLGLDPMPEKLPLNVTYGGELDRGDYVVKRVYWQTWPEVYASGYLYLPKTPGKHPAILSPHGHLSLGTRDPAEQTRSIALAKKGYVSLAIDSAHLPAESFLIGASSLTVMIFNGIRGVDLLETLPEVDVTKIGCAGMSGGGQQTTYMMLADDRIAAAVPVVYISWFRRIMNTAGFPHCICNIVPGLLRDVDEPEIAATYAPKPAFIECVTGDWTSRFPKEEYPEIQAVYALYGAKDAVGVQQWVSGHDYFRAMREPTYAFFNHHLKHVDDPAEAKEPDVPTETQDTLATLDHPPAEAKPLEAIVDWYRTQYGCKPAIPEDAAGWKQYQAGLRAGLARVLGDAPVHGELISTEDGLNLFGRPARRLTIRTEPGIQVSAMLITPSGEKAAPVAILTHEQGISGLLTVERPRIETLLNADLAVALAEVRLTGVLARNWSLDGVLWGRPEVGMAATDLRAIADVLAGQPGLDGRRMALVGLGDTNVTALCAAALDERFAAVAIPALGATYAEGRKSPLIGNLLRVADLPQLAATIAPRPLLIGGFSPSPLPTQPDVLRFARQAYAGLDARPRFHTFADSLPIEQLTAALKAAPGK